MKRLGHAGGVLGSVATSVTFQSLDATVHGGLVQERLMAILSGFFGLLAAIAAIGLYGVMSYLVVRQTNEIGVRVALDGSRPAMALSSVVLPHPDSPAIPNRSPGSRTRDIGSKTGGPPEYRTLNR